MFEVSSAGTFDTDEFDKYELYERLGVEEYYIYDPQGVTLGATLKGFRLHGGVYRRIRYVNGGLSSKFGFILACENNELRLFDSATGRRILTGSERAVELQAEVEMLKTKLHQLGQSKGIDS